jgi:hypothetical protein
MELDASIRSHNPLDRYPAKISLVGLACGSNAFAMKPCAKKLLVTTALLHGASAFGSEEFWFIDFEGPPISTPSVWNAVDEASAFSLVTESGIRTALNLTISGATARISTPVSTNSAPTHSTPLTQLSEFALGNSEIRIEISNLVPLTSYGVWVFGLYDGQRPNSTSQRVTVTGSTEISFVQTLAGNTGRLLVNGSVGSSMRSLASYQLNVVTDAIGNLGISVANQNSLTGEIGVAGAALFGPVPTTNAAPRLAPWGFDSRGQFQVAVEGTVGATYVVQRTAKLHDESWLAVATNAAPFTFTETGGLDGHSYFYRAVAK